MTLLTLSPCHRKPTYPMTSITIHVAYYLAVVFIQTHSQQVCTCFIHPGRITSTIIVSL